MLQIKDEDNWLSAELKIKKLPGLYVQNPTAKFRV